MRQTIGLMAACAALLASCTNEEMNEGLGIDTPIQVTASVEGALTTRTDNSTESLTEFGLSIKDGQSYDGDYAGENILAESENGTWTLDKTVLYKGSGQSYFAYAPYNADMEKGATTYAFSVRADQSAEGAMQASDLLHAWGSVTSANLDITLAHKLSKLTVTVTKKGETTPIEVGDVTLRGTKPTTTLALVDGDSGVKAGDLGEASGTETSEIKMWHNTTGGTYECILVPQATAFGVSFTYGGDTYLWESASYTFEGGNAYTLALTFDGKVSVGKVTVSGWGEPTPIEGGTATETNYTYDASTNTYTVYTAEGLQKWADAVGESSLRNPVNCTLAADIDMTGQNWTPIMTGYAPQYNGVFDGNGHTITGLGNCLLGENKGEVRNLTLVNPTGLTLPGSSFSAGAVAGINEGTIENCHVVGGSVKGYAYSGGIVGINMGGIRACSSSAMVTTDGYNGRGGGIVGDNAGPVLACYATGSVNAGDGMEGAIAGENANNYGGIMTACYWSGDAGKGVGSGTDNTMEVGDGNWSTAMNAMNTALIDAGSTYRWTTNGDGETGNHPLIITTE